MLRVEGADILVIALVLGSAQRDSARLGYIFPSKEIILWAGAQGDTGSWVACATILTNDRQLERDKVAVGRKLVPRYLGIKEAK